MSQDIINIWMVKFGESPVIRQGFPLPIIRAMYLVFYNVCLYCSCTITDTHTHAHTHTHTQLLHILCDIL